MSKNFPACPADRSARCWACRIWKSITFHSSSGWQIHDGPIPILLFLDLSFFWLENQYGCTWKYAMTPPNCHSRTMKWNGFGAFFGRQTLIQILVHIQRQSQRNYSPKIPGISPPNIRWSDPVWGTAWSRRDSSSCSSCFFSWEFLLSISPSSWSWIGIKKNPLKSSGLSPRSPLVW